MTPKERRERVKKALADATDQSNQAAIAAEQVVLDAAEAWARGGRPRKHLERRLRAAVQLYVDAGRVADAAERVYKEGP